ncbi:MAG: hypothetical protein JWO83_1664 [Caulobacteraceae bacterium]|jgi:hypothetical protein|nr:hypothetical protein [Caulobacteraceae bacterium]
MAIDLTTTAVDEASLQGEAHSAVSWGAVLAGAVAALALSFVLVALAGGFALKLPTPWPGALGASAHFSPTVGALMMVVQVLSSALGGYLAGRLRTKWVNVHGHEAHFRDTAHGLLTWAVSTLAGVVLVAMVLAPLEERAAALDASAVVYEATVSPLPVDPVAIRMRMMREANLAAQASFFMGVGLLLGAFTASVAAAVGGQRRDDMHARYWAERPRAGQPVGP